MQPNKLKILMIGPSESGKTQIANFLSNSINIDEAGNPKPTQGLRIVEFEQSNINYTGRNVDIELWDCSGDHRFESCWPALRFGVKGVILVCSSNTSEVAPRELELLYNYFVSQPKLSTKQCVVFYNCVDDQYDVGHLNLSSTFSRISQVAVNLRTERERLKTEFSNYITSVLQSV
ncbi:intraflagellar transport protein 22 homolog [Bombyx mori]|uniref:Intraflagellar transport protein 22 homolog n=1 Tax=Bombyx mori TaxID=7091 RepID=A0A8R1WKT4_BOMMO|nr:intraflagellar transport protein 22 homolog [Bombyx mori]